MCRNSDAIKTISIRIKIEILLPLAKTDNALAQGNVVENLLPPLGARI